MSRPQLSREVIDRFRRERLLDAVVAATAKHGYRHATVATVAATARTSRSGFYEHFPNKEEAFHAALAEGLGQLERSVDEACATNAGEDFPTRIRAALVAMVDWIQANLAMAHLCLVDAATAGVPALEQQIEFRDRLAKKLRAAAPLRVDQPPSIDEMVVAGVLSVIAQRISLGDPEATSALAPELGHLIGVPYGLDL